MEGNSKLLPISYCSTNDIILWKKNPLLSNKGNITKETHRTFAEEVQKIEQNCNNSKEIFDFQQLFINQTPYLYKIEQVKKPKMSLMEYKEKIKPYSHSDKLQETVNSRFDNLHPINKLGTSKKTSVTNDIVEGGNRALSQSFKQRQIDSPVLLRKLYCK